MDGFWQGLSKNKAFWAITFSAIAAQGLKIVLGRNIIGLVKNSSLYYLLTITA
ncbi:MAG: hypothetical protein HQ570_00750 [Candidatus Omnitrophica bacterium]|nr:hypothetical protein [Candidatus Omnitrophota bacterium]